MRSAKLRGIVSSPDTTTYESIRKFKDEYGAPADNPVYDTAPYAGQTLAIPEMKSVSSPITGDQAYRVGDKYVNLTTALPSKTAKMVTLPGHIGGGITSLGGGQYFSDPEQPDKLIMIDRNDPVYGSKEDRINKLLLERRGLPGHLYEVDHIWPIFLGGTNNDVNKMILTKSAHERKTKQNNVIRELFYRGDLSREDAARYALNWQDFNVDNINYIDKYGNVDYFEARKKFDEWQADPNMTIFQKTSDAFRRWGAKAAVKTAGRDLKDLIYETANELEDKGWAGVAGQTALKASIAMINNSPLGLFGVKPLPGLYDVEGVEPVKGKEMASKIAGAAGTFAGSLAGLFAGFGLLKTALTLPGKIMTATKAGSAIASSLGSLKLAKAITAYPGFSRNLATTKYLGAIPVIRNLQFSTGAILRNIGMFSVYDQLTPAEKTDVQARAETLKHSIIYGTIFSTIAPGTKNMRALASDMTAIAAPTFILAKVAGKDNEEALLEASTMAAMHGAITALHGQAILGIGPQQDINYITKRASQGVIKSYADALKISERSWDTTATPEGRSTWGPNFSRGGEAIGSPLAYGATGRIRPIHDKMTAEDIQYNEDLITNEVKRQQAQGLISETGAGDMLNNTALFSRWLKTETMPEGKEKVKLQAEIIEESRSIFKKAIEQKRNPDESSRDSVREFIAANENHPSTGDVETTIPVEEKLIDNAPTGKLETKPTSIRTDREAYQNAADLARVAKENPDEARKVYLTLEEGYAPFIEARNKVATETGNTEAINPNPKNTVVVQALDQNGNIVRVAKLEGETANAVAESLRATGAKVAPATIAMERAPDGRYYPKIEQTPSGDIKMTVDLNKGVWIDTLKGTANVKAEATATKASEVAAAIPEATVDAKAMKQFIAQAKSAILGGFPETGYARDSNYLATRIGEILDDPVDFNKKYSNKGKQVLSDELVTRIRTAPEKVRVGDIMAELWDAKDSGALKDGPAAGGQMSKITEHLGLLEDSMSRMTTAEMARFKQMLEAELGTLSSLRERAAKAIQESTQKAIETGKAALERTKNIAKSMSKETRPSGKSPAEMTAEEAVRATPKDFAEWEAARLKPATSKKDLKEARELFDVYLQRGERKKAISLIDKLDKERAYLPEKLIGKLEDTLKEMDNAMKVEDFRLSYKKLPEKKGEQQKEQVSKAIKGRPKMTEEEAMGKIDPMFNARKKVAEAKRLEAEDKKNDSSPERERAVEKKAQEPENVEASAREQKAVIEDMKPGFEGEVITDPADVKDPQTFRNMVYDTFFSFDKNKRLVAGAKVIEQRIREAIAAGKKELTKEMKEDLRKFSSTTMRDRVDHHIRHSKGKMVVAQERFLDEYDALFKKYGENILSKDGGWKTFPARQALRHRFILLATRIPKPLFTIRGTLSYDKKTGTHVLQTEKVTARNAPVGESRSYFDEMIREFRKKNGWAPEMAYFDTEKSTQNLSQEQIVDALNRSGYIFIGQSKNAKSSIRALKYDKRMSDMFDKNQSTYIPDKLKNEFLNPDGTSNLSDQDKAQFVLGREVLGMHDKIDTKSFVERAQLWDSKEPVNMAHQGGKYNVVVLKSDKTLGETLDKDRFPDFESFYKFYGGNREELLNTYNRPVYDGDIYVTKEWADDVRLANGFIDPIAILKPTQAGKYVAPDGQTKLLMQKGQIQVMDGRLKKIFEDKLGRKLTKFDIITNDQNVKFGLENRIGELKPGGFFEQKVGADSFRFSWKKPHEIAGSFGISAFSKLPMEADPYINKMLAEPAADFIALANMLRAPATGEQIIGVFNHFLDKYHVDIPKHMYSEIVDSIKMNAGMKTHGRRIEQLVLSIFQNKLLAGGFLRRDYLQLVPDHGYLNGKFIQGDDAMVSHETLKGLYGEDYLSKTEQHADGYRIWKDSKEPLNLVSVRYPINSPDNPTAGRVYRAEDYGVKNLGRNGVVLSHENVYIKKNGDYDADAIAAFAVGKDSGAIPQGLADIIKGQKGIVPDLSMAEKRKSMPLKWENVLALSNNVGLGEQGIGSISSGLRTMRQIIDAGTKITATPNKKDGTIEFDAYFGDSKKPFRPDGKPLYIRPMSYEEKRTGGKQVDLWPKNIDYVDQQGKTISSFAVDAAKSDGLYNHLQSKRLSSGKAPRTYSKEQFYRDFFAETGSGEIKDRGFIKALHALNGYFQLPHRLSKGDHPKDVLREFLNPESKFEKNKTKTQLEQEEPVFTPSNFEELEPILKHIYTLIDAIRASGGRVHPTLSLFEHFKSLKPVPDYAQDLELQYRSDKEARKVLNEVAGDYIADSWKKIPEKELGKVLLLREQVSTVTDAYNLYSPPQAKNAYVEWGNEALARYGDYKVGALKASENNGRKVLTEAEWKKAKDSLKDLYYNDVGQTYQEYKYGYGNDPSESMLTLQEWREANYSYARKKMVKELQKRMDELSEPAVDVMAHYLATDHAANVKSHPAWRERNENMNSGMIWRYDEVIPKSPMIAKIYYTAKERYIPTSGNFLSDLMSSGRSYKPFTIEEAKEIMKNFGRLTKSERQKILEDAADLRRELNASDDMAGLGNAREIKGGLIDEIRPDNPNLMDDLSEAGYYDE